MGGQGDRHSAISSRFLVFFSPFFLFPSVPLRLRGFPDLQSGFPDLQNCHLNCEPSPKIYIRRRLKNCRQAEQIPVET